MCITRLRESLTNEAIPESNWEGRKHGEVFLTLRQLAVGEELSNIVRDAFQQERCIAPIQRGQTFTSKGCGHVIKHLSFAETCL